MLTLRQFRAKAHLRSSPMGLTKNVLFGNANEIIFCLCALASQTCLLAFAKLQRSKACRGAKEAQSQNTKTKAGRIVIRMSFVILNCTIYCLSLPVNTSTFGLIGLPEVRLNVTT